MGAAAPFLYLPIHKSIARRQLVGILAKFFSIYKPMYLTR
jgi:hypothetical protein